VASDRGVEGDRGGWVVGWWVLIQAVVRAVIIEMAHVAVKDSSGVSFVVDQQPVGALGADAADEPLRIAVRASHPVPCQVTSAELVYERAPCDLFCTLGG